MPEKEELFLRGSDMYSSRSEQNIFSMWFIVRGLNVFMAFTKERKIIVPILEFDKIGQDGDFTKPFTYSLQYMEADLISSEDRVSRNAVPTNIKDYFRAFYRSGEERRDGVEQKKIGLVSA